jgi:predicted nucleic acid binding AN1-type Zn finger protein
MLGYECKHCTHEYCKLHRLPEEHNCEVDFITLGKKQIKIDNPSISTKKIEQI